MQKGRGSRACKISARVIYLPSRYIHMYMYIYFFLPFFYTPDPLVA